MRILSDILTISKGAEQPGLLIQEEVEVEAASCFVSISVL